MPSTLLPTHEFSSEKKRDIPFEIGRIEHFPSIARSGKPHRHTFYEVFFIHKGLGVHSIDFVDYPIHPRTLYFISPGQVHFWRIEQELFGVAILFTEDFLLGNVVEPLTARSFAFFDRVDHTPYLHISQNENLLFDELYIDMFHEYNDDAYGRLTVLQSLLRILLIRAQRLYTQGTAALPFSTTDHLVNTFIRLIDIHYQEHQQVQKYAALLGVTPGHLTEVVRERTGRSASQHIYQRVALEAKRLLAYSDKTIAEIAFMLSFSDPSYFTRFFRRESGLTPTQYRLTIREKYRSDHKSSL
jgi:AraC-like DNA-binding protein